MSGPGERIRIAVDAMGGDHGPEVIVRGAVEALCTIDGDFEILLVGDESRIWDILGGMKLGPLPIFSVHAEDQVAMDEKVPKAMRSKPRSSIALCTGLVGRRRAGALVSAGNTGALVAASLLNLGRMPGIQRPAITATIPTPQGQCVMLDVGANADCKPVHLFQFAHMGRIFAKLVLGIAEPRVGLLNIGEEASKGSALAQAAHELLAADRDRLNFVGNVEGRDIFAGRADVVVCDGFTGNVILKLAGSIAAVGSRMAAHAIERSPLVRLGALLMKPALSDLKRRFNYEEYGGALLLGTHGISVICHGRSSPRAIRNAIWVALRAIRGDLEGSIARVLSEQEAGRLAAAGESAH
ncbi:MAG: phosphate acyltransferase PlsX [Candidatus Eisenbacteria bacterium]